MIVGFLREEFTRNALEHARGAGRDAGAQRAARAHRPAQYNGASLLGLRGIVFKSHGSADAFAFGQALERALEEVRNDVPSASLERMAQMPAAMPAARRNDRTRASSAPAATCRARVMTNAELARAASRPATSGSASAPASRARHIADEDADLERPRARSAPRRRSRRPACRPSDIDLIIVATSTPDYVFPSTACLLQAKLGMKGCAAFDVQAVCSGFVYALAIADALHQEPARRRRRWWSAPKCSRASSTGTTAAPACCSATAPAPWCSVSSDKPGIHASRAARRRQPCRHPLGAGQRLRAARSSARRSCRWTGRRCSSSRCACSTSRRARRWPRPACSSRTSTG